MTVPSGAPRSWVQAGVRDGAAAGRSLGAYPGGAGPRAVCVLIFKEKLEICTFMKKIYIMSDGKITFRGTVIVGRSLV